MLKYIAIVIASTILCLAAATPLRAQTALPVIRVGLAPSDGGAPLFYAQKAEIFKRHGVEVQFITLSNGSAALAALAGGSIDVAQGTALPVIQGYARGLPLTIIGNSAIYQAVHPNQLFIVRADSDIRTPKDLEGRTLSATSLQDISVLVTADWLKSLHVDISRIKYVELPASALGAAFEQHRVDGAAIFEPYYSQLVAEGKARILGYPYNVLGDHFSQAVLTSQKDWASAHADVVSRFLSALREASAYVGTHEQSAAAITAEFTGTTASTLNSIDHPRRSIVLTPSDIQPLIAILAKNKLIDRSFPASELICTCAPTH